MQVPKCTRKRPVAIVYWQTVQGGRTHAVARIGVDEPTSSIACRPLIDRTNVVIIRRESPAGLSIHHREVHERVELHAQRGVIRRQPSLR